MKNIRISNNVLTVDLADYTATITVSEGSTYIVLEEISNPTETVMPVSQSAANSFRSRLLELAKNKSVEL